MKLLDHGLCQLHKNLGVIEMAYDTITTDDKIVIKLPVPGLHECDIDVRIVGNRRLIVKNTRDCKFTKEFYYVFAIPCEIIKDDTYIVLRDGILTICVQKKV
jgi:HSP20 family molecular chaperone IbpA